jgi:hypothetical protein
MIRVRLIHLLYLHIEMIKQAREVHTCCASSLSSVFSLISFSMAKKKSLVTVP